MSIDSLYAITATPVKLTHDKKRKVNQVDESSGINTEHDDQAPNDYVSNQSASPKMTHPKKKSDDLTDDDAPLKEMVTKPKINIEV